MSVPNTRLPRANKASAFNLPCATVSRLFHSIDLMKMQTTEQRIISFPVNPNTNQEHLEAYLTDNWKVAHISTSGSGTWAIVVLERPALNQATHNG